MSIREQNHFLDCLKGIGCILVVFIHIALPGQIGVVLSKLGRYVVPLFFMISGYYAYHEETSIVHKKLPHKMMHISKIILCITPLYVLVKLIEIVRYEGYGKIFLWLRGSFDIKGIIRIVCLNNLDFMGGEALWFLPALVYAYVFLFLVNKLSMYRFAYGLSIILFIGNVIIGNMEGMNWHYTNNFLLEGIPYLMCGNFLARHKNALADKKIKNMAMVVSVIALSVVMLNAFYICPDIIGNIGTIVFSISIFIVAVQMPHFTIGMMIEYIGNKLSLYIYVLHCAVSRCIALVITYFVRDVPKWYFYIKPFVVLMITVIIAIGCVKVSEAQKSNRIKGVSKSST